MKFLNVVLWASLILGASSAQAEEIKNLENYAPLNGEFALLGKEALFRGIEDVQDRLYCGNGEAPYDAKIIEDMKKVIALPDMYIAFERNSDNPGTLLSMVYMTNAGSVIGVNMLVTTSSERGDIDRIVTIKQALNGSPEESEEEICVVKP